MSLLKTVVTYQLPSEAEIDKAFLESHGIDVCLFNGNTSRNEIGAAFFIQLQVSSEQYAEAVALLRESNPKRFGSAERVAEIEKELLKGLVRFVAVSIPVGIALFFVIPDLSPSINTGQQRYVRRRVDFRLAGALVGGLLAGVYAATRKDKSSKT